MIAAAAGMSGNYRSIMNRMQKLKAGDIEMSDVIREDRYQVEDGTEECIYCVEHVERGIRLRAREGDTAFVPTPP